MYWSPLLERHQIDITAQGRVGGHRHVVHRWVGHRSRGGAPRGARRAAGGLRLGTQGGGIRWDTKGTPWELTPKSIKIPRGFWGILFFFGDFGEPTWTFESNFGVNTWVLSVYTLFLEISLSCLLLWFYDLEAKPVWFIGSSCCAFTSQTSQWLASSRVSSREVVYWPTSNSSIHLAPQQQHFLPWQQSGRLANAERTQELLESFWGLKDRLLNCWNLLVRPFRGLEIIWNPGSPSITNTHLLRNVMSPWCRD